MLAAPLSNRFLTRVKSKLLQATKISDRSGLMLIDLSPISRVGDNQALERMWTANSNWATLGPKILNQTRILARSFFRWALDSNLATASIFPNCDGPSGTGGGRKPLSTQRYVHECCAMTRFVLASSVILSMSNKPFSRRLSPGGKGHSTDLPRLGSVSRVLHSVAVVVVDYEFGQQRESVAGATSTAVHSSPSVQ